MRFLLLLFWLFFMVQANAQHDDLNFINYSSKDGLSSNMVNAMLKDKYGYMWFATDDGLNRFDGVSFKVYRNNANDSTSIGGNNITALCEDKSGNLWIGTNQTLSLYSRKKDAFTNHYLIRNSLTRALCVDHLGNIWMGSYSGLYMFNPKTGLNKHYPATPYEAGQLMSSTVVSVFEDSQKRLWIGTNGGLHLYIREKDNFISYQHSTIDSESLPDNTVRSITEDLRGNIWLGTNGGLSKLARGGKNFENYRYSATDPNTISCDRIYVVASDNTGRLWVGTEAGLNIVYPSSGHVVRVVNDPRNKYSFIGKSIRSSFIDKNGIVWLGTNNSGVNKFDQNLAFFNLRQSNPLDPAGLSGSVVASFVENSSGDIYIGTDGGGLNLYRRKTGLFEHPKLAARHENQPLSILALEKIEDEIWIGTYQQGLYVLNTVSGAVDHYTKGSGPKNISGSDVFCIKKDRNNNIWIGTNGDGINVYDSRTRTFKRFNKSSTTPGEQLPLNGYIRSIEEDGFGNIWIGSHGSGIAVYNLQSKKFMIFNKGNNKLLSDNILDIYKDSDGNMWVGTLGSGLCMFDQTTNQFINYSEGLSNAVIYKILEDASGKLWVSTNAGLSSFDSQNKKFKNYTSQNGLQRSSFNRGAGIKTSKGELFFGGVDGFNYFNPALLRSNKNVPSLVFTDLKVANRSVIPGDDAVIKDHISIAKEIRLDFKQNFSLDFAALNFTSPQDNRYFYKLEGFEKNWNDVGSLHTAVYTNLDPGEYKFRVRAKSDDGLWSTEEVSINIYVKPPFWRTSYAYVLYVLVFAFSIGLIRYRAIRRIKNKFALEQERKEAERKHEFDELKIKFLTNLSHEFRTPISLIVAPLEKMLELEADEQKQQQLNFVQRNARRLLNLVNQLLDFRKLEESELKLNLSQGDIISFCKEVSDSFKDVSENKHINFSFSGSPDHFYTYFDRDKIERILFNLLSNAFKFTNKDGNISLRVEKKADANLEIIVSDTGVGMDSKEQEKIFDRFFQGDSGAGILNQGSGIGLSITKEFVKLHGGTIEVKSEPGKGTVFTIALPCEPVNTSLDNGKNPQAVNKKLQEQGAVPGPEKHTVLLIEDNDDFRSYLKLSLNPYYKIVEASDGKEGWQKALFTHPKVIVSDISMPGMDGVMLARKLKSDKRTMHIPIILLTALKGNSNEIKGLQTGACDYLTKPFSFEILNIKINNLLSLNQSFKETYSKQLSVSVPDIKVESEDEKLLLKITAYIESNIDSPDLSVEDLSKHVYMTRGSLYNKIVSLTGETPVEFIRSSKLNKAAALLQNSDMKIAEIGYAVGFATPNYFARAFKAKFNISPSEYMRLKRGSGGLGQQSQQIHI